MLYLQGLQQLQLLEKSLLKHLPESLKVYGTVFHMNQGNPFKLKALVDKWPDFNTLVIRPEEQEMTDDLDHYTNTYQIFSKDPKNCQEFLSSPEVINWKQHLQIQSLQASLDKVIKNLVAVHLGQVKHTQCFLYLIQDTAKKLTPSLLDGKNSPPNGYKPKSLNQEMFKPASLDITHAALVNKFWYFGGNERSQRFIERCIRTFPSFCLLGPEGTPVSWSMMDQTGELRIGATVPKYRGQGLLYHIACCQIQTLEKLGFPMYAHVSKVNHMAQRLSSRLRHVPMPCDWNQWNCVPL
ncbi:glycine N-acyltransferase-like protein Keg1 isoform X1 [Sciurus carolinensis]|uniref:glycine N-acyltransferase-like protein Keg1 isoform X1 n=2 Tax=Sciurus carolinensis TaxID=30640 RepID=UPI001FB3F6F6|nr:glycine N-acyltransferase-like protein Keg1 isoform X1 [Sciurus carolinensis]XP_047373529.1 glycine N-acyltransferase-like protein Keg1 isoform X1 [Sciurus carolinensis]